MNPLWTRKLDTRKNEVKKTTEFLLKAFSLTDFSSVVCVHKKPAMPAEMAACFLFYVFKFLIVHTILVTVFSRASN